MRSNRIPARRPGFTMIELLVVIGIIGILVSILLVAVQKVRDKGREVQHRSDISQLDTSIAAFKLKFTGVDYMPSFFVVRPVYAGGDPDFIYLRKLFQRCGTSLGNGTFSIPNVAPGGNYPASVPGSAPGWPLEGDQCLVFFLGGPDAFNGFSTDQSNPFQPPQANGETRIGPFFEFPSDRLSTNYHGSNPYPCFVDPLNSKPYLYFSSRGNNNYNMAMLTGGTIIGDCPSSAVYNAPYPGVAPYFESFNPTTKVYKFINGHSHQILCAGKDGYFGPGGLGDPTTTPPTPQTWSPSTGYPEKTPGADDLSNFSARVLGTAAN
jgi:prepilin-type N-terminal cleavage/methylation domain-containing protein